MDTAFRKETCPAADSRGIGCRSWELAAWSGDCMRRRPEGQSAGVRSGHHLAAFRPDRPLARFACKALWITASGGQPARNPRTRGARWNIVPMRHWTHRVLLRSSFWTTPSGRQAPSLVGETPTETDPSQLRQMSSSSIGSGEPLKSAGRWAVRKSGWIQPVCPPPWPHRRHEGFQVI